MRFQAQALLLALLLPGAALAQQGPPAGAAPGAGPIERLLQRKTELALTSDQVQKLEAIRQKSAARERELVGKVTEARGVLTAEQNAKAWGRAGQCCGSGPGAMRRGAGRGPGGMHGAGMGMRRGR